MAPKYRTRISHSPWISEISRNTLLVVIKRGHILHFSRESKAPVGEGPSILGSAGNIRNNVAKMLKILITNLRPGSHYPVAEDDSGAFSIEWVVVRGIGL